MQYRRAHSAGLSAGLSLSCTSLAGSQPDIAAAIAASGIPREQLWITSKLNVESVRAQVAVQLRGSRRKEVDFHTAPCLYGRVDKALCSWIA
jgi:diketogulonate reductase-like aldo/keto reductase